MKYSDVIYNLDEMIPNPRCELNYSNDYELLIATVLSAQCTDKRVNEVTKILFSKYDINKLAQADIKDVQKIIYSLGSHTKKAKYIIDISKCLVKDFNGKVPNNRKYLESLPGVGRKTCNVVLANIYNVPTFAVDTHVKRVSVRLGIASESDDISRIEEKLMRFFPEKNWIKLHHQLVLFGRYICKSKRPDCSNCLFNCAYKKNVRN